MKPTFSERMGHKPATTVLQTDHMGDSLRNSIWNVVASSVKEILRPDRHNGYDTIEYGWERLAEDMTQHFLKRPLDDVPHRGQCRGWVRDLLYAFSWNEVYDWIEFINWLAVKLKVRYLPKGIDGQFNAVLEEEMSAYRIIQGHVVPIGSAIEMRCIQDASASSLQSGCSGAYHHIERALLCFSKKPVPDYYNTVKESISAVESVACQVTGNEKAQLGPALKILEGRGRLHSAMRAAFEKLYGYTSNEGGIRHAMLEDSGAVGFDEAKFMLVACSAFVHFLISKTAQ
ncbi:MAG TPA: hypothetical protein PKI11_06320 [Candidatus Hydrogenedentes bacterium]|nr:hypothetical protein [Candidatus Hydrogenedentota bacterium]